ncbi:MAG: hypothetical protein KBD76_05335 [Bacteriovorax sp.]|nr:hypothetical protein [Bacteriovorax sp.]
MNNLIFNKISCEQMPDDVSRYYKNNFTERAVSVYESHLSQNPDDVNNLNLKYKNHVFFGEKTIYECLEMLALVVDPSDTELFTTNQLIHSLQVAEMMEKDGLSNEWIIIGLVHDLGKILLLTNELAENVVGPNIYLSKKNEQPGLDNLILSWNHDEYIYMKIGHLFRSEMSNLLRYHSLRYENCLELMSAENIKWVNDYLLKFRYYDLTSKSVYYYPKKSLKDYRDLIDAYFPSAVVF